LNDSKSKTLTTLGGGDNGGESDPRSILDFFILDFWLDPQTGIPRSEVVLMRPFAPYLIRNLRIIDLFPRLAACFRLDGSALNNT
jgi:hypothetical protein